MTIAATTAESASTAKSLTRHAKTGGFVAVILAHLAWVTTQVSQVRTDNAVLQTQMTVLIDRVNKAETHQQETDRAVSDIGRKLDTAISILGRIDDKVGRP